MPRASVEAQSSNCWTAREFPGQLSSESDTGFKDQIHRPCDLGQLFNLTSFHFFITTQWRHKNE